MLKSIFYFATSAGSARFPKSNDFLSTIVDSSSIDGSRINNIAFVFEVIARIQNKKISDKSHLYK